MTNTSIQVSYFKKEAKKLYHQAQAGDHRAIARIKKVLKDPTGISLMRIQHVIAVEFGFTKWEDLVKTPVIELQAMLDRRTFIRKQNTVTIDPTETPLGYLLRGPKELRSTSNERNPLADMFDRMTPSEQRRYLDEEAKAMGLFD